MQLSDLSFLALHLQVNLLLFFSLQVLALYDGFQFSFVFFQLSDLVVAGKQFIAQFLYLLVE